MAINEKEVVTKSIVKIKLEGTEISQRTMDALEEMMVDQHAHLPGMFRLRFYDPDFSLIEKGPFNLAKEVEISGMKEDDSATVLIKGEITALEPIFAEGMLSYLVVHGYDKSHRLYRETKSKAFLNKKDSDLANEFARNAGLSAQVDTTSTVYDHIFQDNQSDMSFLMQRAWRIGYECFVEDGKLYFRKPPRGGASTSLTWGEDLLTFMPRMSLAEQVDEVVVRGWDAKNQKAIIGQAKKGMLYPKNGENKDGAKWASSFGTGKLVIVDQPVVSQAEANKLAEARLNELSGSFIEAEGEAFRRPDIRAGQIIELKEISSRFSGSYLVTSAMHRFTREGLKTTFRVRGIRTGLLSDEMLPQSKIHRWLGVVTAVVTNTDDPENWGRVKVKFPWMSDDAESEWARVISVGGGPDAGLYAMPDVGDEVAVAFEHGDINRPFVLGGLWNAKHKVPKPVSSSKKGERPLARAWHSRKGHHIVMYDDQNNKIEVMTTGGHKIILDDKNKKVLIESSSGHKLELDDNGRKVTLKSGGDVEIQGDANINVKAAMNLKLEAGGMMDIKASGMVNIKGSMVKIN